MGSYTVNHLLRFIIIDIVKRIASIDQFFEQLQMIYTAFKKPELIVDYREPEMCEKFMNKTNHLHLNRWFLMNQLVQHVRSGP